MSYLLHGSTSHTGMGWVDQVPRAGKLYIGGLYALYQTDLIRAAGITHVLSVIDYDPLLQDKFAHLRHFHIRADDHPNEDLLQHFPEAVRYIDQALKGVGRIESTEKDASRDDAGGTGGVFVHCAMGKSRSATLVVAYLMWKYDLDAGRRLINFAKAGPSAIQIQDSRSSSLCGRRFLGLQRKTKADRSTKTGRRQGSRGNIGNGTSAQRS